MNSLIFDINKNKSGLFLPNATKEPLLINISTKNDNDKFRHEIDDLQKKIQKTAHDLLYQWSNFEIAFPNSITGLCSNMKDDNDDDDDDDDDKNDSSEADRRIKDLFILPSFDELEELAIDSSGKRRKLNDKQLDEIRKNGEFEVESAHFPALKHKWRLAKWLQLGSIRSNDSFYSDLAKSLHLIIVTAKRRFTGKSNCFSLRQGIKSWRRGIYRLLDLFIGMPHYSTANTDERILEELQMFLVAELSVDDKENEIHKKFCEDFAANLLESKRTKNKSNHQIKEKSNLKPPHVFRTPDGSLIDLRLLDEDLMKSIMPLLTTIMECNTQNDKEWLSQLRKAVVTKFKDVGLNDEKVKENAEKEIVEAYLERAFNKILKIEELDKISKNIGVTLVNQAKAYLIIRKADDEFTKLKDKHLADYKNSLKNDYPIKSRVGPWINERVEIEEDKFVKSHLYSSYEMALDELKKNNLQQAAYFVNREMIFKRERERTIRNELAKIKTPSYTFTLYRNIWFPKNWIIKKHNADTCEYTVVKEPNVFKDEFLPPVHVNSTITYLLDRYSCYKTSTLYPFWRWKVFFLRTVLYMANSYFYFGLVIPFCSSLSLRALFSVNPFYPDKQINPTTGTLHPYKPSRTLTFISRLRAIWANVFESRRKFESTPDKGLIGKSFQRIFNKIWNYLFKGVIGTIGLTAVYPALCISVSTLSLALAALVPLWYPFFSILHHLAFALIYDWDSVGYKNAKKVMVLLQVLIFRFFLCGTVFPVTAVGTALTVCPALSIIVLIYACVCKVTRKVWDGIMFHSILKPRARVPSNDTFVARRIAGPGLSSNHFYQISTEQALAALEAKLELIILENYLERVEKLINAPKEDYEQFFNGLVEPFACGLVSNNDTAYDKLNEKTDRYLTKYRDLASKRRNKLESSLSNEEIKKIRLNENDLKVLLSKATELVKQHHQQTIIKYQEKSEIEFFRENGFDDVDWIGLTGDILEEIFGEGFMTPLEHTDTYFTLDVNHLNLTKYTSMIKNSELRDDLDMVMARYNPKRSRLFVNQPYEAPSIYDPKTSTYTNTKIQLPTRLPSNAGIISLLINNRIHPTNPIKYANFDEALRIIKNE